MRSLEQPLQSVIRFDGVETEVTTTDVPESDAAFGDRTVKLLYVSPEEYAELDAEISRILEIVETPSGGKERERFDLYTDAARSRIERELQLLSNPRAPEAYEA